MNTLQIPPVSIFLPSQLGWMYINPEDGGRENLRNIGISNITRLNARRDFSEFENDFLQYRTQAACLRV
jgi:hypothetical protein